LIGLVNVAFYFQRRYFGDTVQPATAVEAAVAGEACPRSRAITDTASRE